jgi:glucose-1-phosphate thymidylyltransferase
MKNGIILLGGNGTRLAPQGSSLPTTNKHLTYLHGKLVVDYSLGTLQSLGCTNVSVILGGDHFHQVAAYLQDGSRYGMNLNYVFQGAATGISQAVYLCKRFVQDDTHFAVALGDSFFDEPVKFKPIVLEQAQVILCKHKQLNRFGVASISNNSIAHIEEKPKTLYPRMEQYAIAGCYLFNQQFFEFFEKTRPSARSEFEIVDILQQYRDVGGLDYTIYDHYWSDVGTHESLQEVQHLLYTKETK